MGNGIHRAHKNKHNPLSTNLTRITSSIGIDTQNSTIRQEGEEVEARDAENHVAAEQVTIKQIAAKGPPEFNLEHKLLIVESWHYVQDHFSEVGITAFMNLFKVSSDLRTTFSFFGYVNVDDEKFYKLVTKHSLRIFAMASTLVKELKSRDSDASDRFIHDTLFPLGRKHVNYRSNLIHMEMLGILILNSLMKTIPRDQLNEHRYKRMNYAYFQFFRVIVYWLKYGFKYQMKHLM